MDDVKSLVRAVVQSKKEGVLARYFQREFSGITGGPVPFSKLGYQSLDEFIRAIPDVVRIGRGADGEETYFAVADKSTMHIQKMVSSQKSAKKRAKGKPFKAVMRRPVYRTAAWSTHSRTSTSTFPGRSRGGGIVRPYHIKSPPKPMNSRSGFGANRPPSFNKPLLNKPPFNTPFTRPSSNVMSQHVSFSNASSQSKPFSNGMSQNQPFSNGIAQNRPFSNEASSNGRSSDRSTSDRSSSVSKPQSRQPTTADPQPIAQTPTKPKPPKLQLRSDSTSKDEHGSQAVSSPNQDGRKNRNSPFCSPFSNMPAFDKAMAAASRNDQNGKRVKPTADGGLEVKVTQPVVASQVTKYGVTYDVAPRFQRLQQKQIDVKKEVEVVLETETGAGDAGRDAAVTSPTTPTKKPLVSQPRRRLSRTGSESGVTDYRGALQAYADFYEYSPPTFQTSRAGRLHSAGYVSFVSIGQQIFGSLSAFLTVEKAEEAAMINAVKDLGISADPEEVTTTLRLARCRISQQESDGESNTHLEFVKARVQELITKRPNGLWSTALPKAYQEVYWDSPPDNLLELVEKWTDIASVEVVGVDRKIIYPVASNSIKLVRNAATFETPTIKETILPEEGEILTVLLGHMVDCSHFYIQCSDSPINKIMQQLQEIYEGRGSPKSLVTADPGTFCIAQYEDGLWYRAQVIRVNETNNNEITFDILYVDFGNIDTVSARCVRRILASSCTEPAQAIRCSLHAVHCMQEDWSDETIAAFRDLAMGRELTMEVVSLTETSCSVLLSDPSNEKAGSINDQLVSRSLARRTELPLEPGPLVIPVESEWNVFVTYINSTTDVVIRLLGAEYADKLDILEEEMASLCDRVLDGEPVVGRTYAAVSISDDDEVTWNRVQVNCVTGDSCEVILLDHGDVDMVKTDCLHPLPAYLNQLPYQAVECKLTGLEPYETDAAIEAKLLEMALGKACVAEVDDRLGKISLTLWDTSTSEDININEAAAKVLKMENLMPKLPEPGGTIEGYVCHIADDGAIYFQCQGPGLQQLENLADQMQELYGKAGSASAFVSSPKLDQEYIAKSSEDSVWYRAVITSLLPGRKVEVYFVDYGNTDIIGYSSLREIGSWTELRSLPRQAIRCELYELPPIPNGVWTPEALDELAALAPPIELCVLEVVEPADEGGSARVAIHASQEDEPTVNEQLALLDYSFWTYSADEQVDS